VLSVVTKKTPPPGHLPIRAIGVIRGSKLIAYPPILYSLVNIILFKTYAAERDALALP